MSRTNLVFILGDQLSLDYPALKSADPNSTIVLMAESLVEICRYTSHKQRIVLFLSAMRHFADALKIKGFNLDYRRIEDQEESTSLPEHLNSAIQKHKPIQVTLCKPGDYSLEADLIQTCSNAGVELEILDDPFFFSTPLEFGNWAKPRKQFTMEYFYREMRKKHDILMENGKPIGGKWNYDEQNRKPFDKAGPRKYPIWQDEPDEVTQAVIDIVETRFKSLPGSLENFRWPVSRQSAKECLEHFVRHLLPDFGAYQDAIWMNQPFLAHSRLASSLNLKLLNPKEVIAAAIEAYDTGHAPLNSVEGFVRQILGWREYMRGVYFLLIPELESMNALHANEPLPSFFWDGVTEMRCMNQVVDQLTEHAYAHHIQRLMVTGLFALLYGVKPIEIHQWYMALYIDSVEWVTMPNTIGMSQFADGGIVATKPYIATGSYINRMSNYCAECRFNPKKAHGDEACPFTTLYWEFLFRHRESLEKNQRMGFQIRNLDRKGSREIGKILSHAKDIRSKIKQSAL